MTLFTPMRRVAGGLVAGLLALGGAGARAQCPTLLVERFVSAECEACWRGGSAPAPGSVVLDWIVPSPRGDEAPLAAAALADAAPRAVGLAPDAALERRHALQPGGLRVDIEDGPAWNGYMALRLRVQRDGKPLPTGAAGYVALVETVPAGEEGTTVARRVVRVVAGPLVLDPSRSSVEHLNAVRIPLGAHAGRLGAVGWVQDSAGQVLAFAATGEAACPR